MLARARAKAAAAGDNVAARIRWLEADLVDVDRRWSMIAQPPVPGPGSFGLAILAVGSILLLRDAGHQRAAVETMSRLVAPGGITVIDAWLVGPEERDFYDGSLSLEWIRDDPETGTTVTKLAGGRCERGSDRLDLTTLFDEGRPGEPIMRWARRDELRLVEPDELEAFARDAGLAIEAVAGEPDMSPLAPDSDRVVIVARRPSPP